MVPSKNNCKQMSVNDLRSLAENPVTCEPLSAEFPWYQGILQGISRILAAYPEVRPVALGDS